MKSINERIAEHADRLTADVVEIEKLMQLGVLMPDAAKALTDFLRNEVRILRAILNGEQYKNYPEFD